MGPGMKSGIGRGLAQLGETAMRTGLFKRRLDQDQQQFDQRMATNEDALAFRLGTMLARQPRQIPQSGPMSMSNEGEPRFEQDVGRLTLPALPPTAQFSPTPAPRPPAPAAPSPLMAGATTLLGREMPAPPSVSPDLTAGREQELLGRGIMAGTPVPPSTAVIRSPYR